MPVELFQPIAVTAPHPHFARRSHPVPPRSLAIPADKDEKDRPAIPTNNFYSNLYLGNQDQPVFMCPYALWWDHRGEGPDAHYGLSISQTSREQRVYGPDPGNPNAQYFFHPAGIRSMSLSAFEFDKTMTMELSSAAQFSVVAQFKPGSVHGSGKVLNVPIVLGTGFISGIYYNLIPRMNSAVGFKIFKDKPSPRKGIQKYGIELRDGTKWLVYAWVPEGEHLKLKKDGEHTVTAEQRVRSVLFQICKLVDGAEKIYDNFAGKYSNKAQMSGTANGTNGDLRINWSTRQANNANALLLFALPHHVASFSDQMKKRALGFGLDSPTKGKMMAYGTNDFFMHENLPVDINFMPWTSIPNVKMNQFSNEALGHIYHAACDELEQDVNAQCNLNSMYFSGKALDKFAFIAYVAHEILGNLAMTQAAMNKVANAFRVFSANKQQYPLVYDTTYKGIVSSGSFVTENALEDFGNTYYNDHHFHYGYFIHAAAIIGYIDSALGGTWVYDNKDFVNTLVRDIANPSEQDPYFPISRSFDWFHGHSWAKGLFESGDGKDQESTSEDYHHAYAIKLWGKVSGDKSMEARGNMMLAIMKRSFNSYFMMLGKNTIQDPRILSNKVTGILFENKIDHTTYFSPRIECVQGIHMIPITSVSSYMRSPEFVYEEWSMLLQRVAETVDDGWKGILYANVALFDPRASWQFFAHPKFSNQWLDGGASRTWYLTYAAGVGGA
ncbi:endo-1,3(4)-beta-glucanase [Kockiozyma suomiensis]|uniref:endo-1,3(4)-beta-glucanase n=1 Tax=Kockiozyma suomiensis TaxID=1337062 RepID=UPI0033435E4F